MKLCELIGNHILSGVEFVNRKIKLYDNSYEQDCWCIMFTLDGITYLAVEDAEDGYRSTLATLLTVDETCRFKLPDVPVCCVWRDAEDAEVLSFVDQKNGKEVLAIGTDYYDDYYPNCIMEYIPENLACNSSIEG